MFQKINIQANLLGGSKLSKKMFAFQGGIFLSLISCY